MRAQALMGFLAAGPPNCSKLKKKLSLSQIRKGFFLFEQIVRELAFVPPMERYNKSHSGILKCRQKNFFRWFCERNWK